MRNSLNTFPAKLYLKIMPQQSRLSENPLTICTIWGFSRKPQKYIFSTITWVI